MADKSLKYPYNWEKKAGGCYLIDPSALKMVALKLPNWWNCCQPYGFSVPFPYQ